MSSLLYGKVMKLKNLLFLSAMKKQVKIYGVPFTAGWLISLGNEVVEKLEEERFENIREFQSETLKGKTNFCKYEGAPVVENNIFYLRKCPFEENGSNSHKEFEPFLDIIKKVTKYHNDSGGFSASPFCIYHQSWRDALAKKTKIGTKSLEIKQLACRFGITGDVHLASKNIESLGLDPKKIEAALQDYVCAYHVS